METLPQLSEIQRRREALGWTQARLAKAASKLAEEATGNRVSVSRPAVTQTEARGYIPNYEVAKAIFEALVREEELRRSERLEGIKTEPLGNFAVKPVIHVSPVDKVVDARDLMKEHDFSQIPVISVNDNCVGTLTDGLVVRAIERLGTLDKVYSSAVEECMGEPLPVLGETTPLESVMPLLEAQKAVLVSKKGKISGIVTPFDVMRDKDTKK